MTAAGRLAIAGLVLACSAASAVAGDGGFLRFLFSTPPAVAARDPHWSYTLQRYLDQPAPETTLETESRASGRTASTAAAPPGAAGGRTKPPAMTGSLPRTGRTATASAATSRAPGAAARSESITGPTHLLTGLASFYWQPQMTASGEVFDPRQMTAAHKTLPFGTRVRVTDVRSGRSVVVRINDRGPYKPGRIIDLSQAAAQVIGMSNAGITPVRLDVLPR